MEGDPFIADVKLNSIKFVTRLVDYGCLCYITISDQLFRSLGLLSISITPRRVKNVTRDLNTLINKVTYALINIDGY